VTCEHCEIPGEGCAYPYYGLAPHTHVGDRLIGSTKLKPKAEWPDNFCEDGEVPGCGIYTHCPECGAPDADQQPESDDG